VTPSIIDFYSTMGNSGCGMVVVGASSVSQEGISTQNCMRVGPSYLEKGLIKLASSIKKTGAISSLQVFHVGSQGNTNYTGQPVLGPSQYVCPDIQISVKELSRQKIIEIEDDFVKAIVSGFRCGFDFIELHLAHGYLLHNFLSEHFNKRSDSYGRSAKNRLRIINNIFEKVRRINPKLIHRIAARISGNDFVPMGLTIEKNKGLIELLNSYNIAYWCVSAGIYETAKMKSDYMKQGAYWQYADKLKKMTQQCGATF